MTTPNAGRDAEKLNQSHITGGRHKMGQAIWKTVWQFFEADVI